MLVWVVPFAAVQADHSYRVEVDHTGLVEDLLEVLHIALVADQEGLDSTDPEADLDRTVRRAVVGTVREEDLEEDSLAGAHTRLADSLDSWVEVLDCSLVVRKVAVVADMASLDRESQSNGGGEAHIPEAATYVLVGMAVPVDLDCSTT